MWNASEGTLSPQSPFVCIANCVPSMVAEPDKQYLYIGGSYGLDSKWDNKGGYYAYINSGKQTCTEDTVPEAPLEADDTKTEICTHKFASLFIPQSIIQTCTNHAT